MAPPFHCPKIGLFDRVWKGVLQIGWALLCCCCPQIHGALSESDSEFFESKIRPILVNHCYSCHSQNAEKVKGSLLLDTAAGVLKGGESGPALVPGEPESSLLIRAVRYLDENLQMPPRNKKLSRAQISALEDWVRRGAPDPRTTAVPTARREDSSVHWAFQQITRPSLPGVRNASWIREPIDAFIAAKLESKGLQPSPPADKRTLIRRVTFDLTGLPPTPEEVGQFLEDDSPDAYAKVVERLLGSPEYGERWARHWLDVARYADTKGYVFEEERRYPYAYTYRDYVIRAFNEDLPFDQFLIQQIAADQLPLDEDKRPLAALGYLTLGRRFLNNTPDIIDDRIDVVTRGMMGLTVACARCHDHKFDPISTRDYYSLYGVFASCSEPEEKPLLGTKGLPPKYPAYLEEHTKRVEELNTFRQNKAAEAQSQVRQLTGDYLLAARDGRRLDDPSKAEGLARERKLDPRTVDRWARQLDAWEASLRHPVLAPWFALADCDDAQWADQAAERLRALLELNQEERFLNPLVAHAFTGPPPASIREVAARFSSIFAEIDDLWQRVAGSADASPTPRSLASHVAPSGLSDPAFEEIRQVLYASDSPSRVPESEITKLFDVPSIQKLRALKRKVEELDATHPGAPPRAMALGDNPTPAKPRVFIRGNPNNPGAEVPRQFPAILTEGSPKPFQKGSGRLELARAIANRANPLTARVFVNRVWLHYFGAGLVRTPSDFGLRSDPPSHPELLDYLAARFMEEGWSVKKLQRWIVLSSTYQQNSDDQPKLAQSDPANLLLGRMNRRRLDFEAMRDSLLAVSSKLDRAREGHSVDLFAEPETTRRTIYGFVERQNLPGMFRTFDFANPDTTSPQRFSTVVPQQALFMINSPFAIARARDLFQRVEQSTSDQGIERVRLLYRMAFQREPTSREIGLALGFIEEQSRVKPIEPEIRSWSYGYGEYDPTSQRLKTFHSLPTFANDSWQGGTALPDPKLGWVILKAGGGHPGNDQQHLAVLRWTAPRRLTVAISGNLKHETDKGDGIDARIISSRAGELRYLPLHNGKKETTLAAIDVQPGEHLDFVVGCRSSPEFDAFTWSPAIKALAAEADAQAGLTTEWDARQDFSGPTAPPSSLTAWERLAQVLLMSNEFVFVD